MNVFDDVSRQARQYATLRTIPAYLSIAYSLLSLYSFHGIGQFTLTWINWTVSQQSAMFGSLLILLIAFMSSETRSFNYYRRWEKLAVAAGPVLILLHGFIPQMQQAISNSRPLQVTGFVLVILSWGVATQ